MLRDPRRTLRELYRGIDGWEIPRAEARRVKSAKSSDTYGEIMPAATQKLFDYLDLGETDGFYDLGCGVGKVVLQAAIRFPLARCVGIELSSTRADLGRRVVNQARNDGLVRARQCSIRCRDFMLDPLAGATCIYTCSTAFPPALMRRLALKLADRRRPHRFVTLQDLDDHPSFALVDVLRLDVTWRRKAKVHVYQVNPRPDSARA